MLDESMSLETRLRKVRSGTGDGQLQDQEDSLAPLHSGARGIARQVDARLPGKGNSNSRVARPVHQIISMIKWIRTSRLSIENSLSLYT